MNFKKLFSDISAKPEYIMVLAFIAMSCMWILFQPLEKAVIFSAIDDALYYPRIAHSAALTGRFSYDGITLTNGFHPLWMILLLPIANLINDPLTGLRIAYWLVFMLMLICLFIFIKISRKMEFTSGGTVLALFLLFLNFRSFLLFFSLIESHVILLCYLCYLYFSVKYGIKRYASSKYAFIIGLIAGACFLARIDSFLLMLSYLAVLMYKLIRGQVKLKDAFGAFAASCAGCWLLVIPYLGINYYWFGRIVTVSSWMKRAEPTMEAFKIINDWFRYQLLPRISYVLGSHEIPYHIALIFVSIFFFLFIMLMYSGIYKTKRLKKLSPISDFILFVLLHFVFIFLYAPFELAASIWYVVPEILLFSMLAGAAIKDYKIKRVQPIPLICGLLIIGQFFYYESFVTRKTMSRAKLEMAAYLKNNLEPGTVCTMYDSGIVSYFSNRQFVGLNGLIGDFELGGMVMKMHYKELAEKYGISVLVIDAPESFINRYQDYRLYTTATKTKFMDFQEGMKPFTAFKVTPELFQEMLAERYKPRN